MTERPKYTEIDHTADVGLEFTAPDLTTAFEHAAAAMFDLICDLDRIDDGVRRIISIRAREGDLPNMMVRWLTELLFLFDSERIIFSRFDVKGLQGGRIEADVAGEFFDPDKHTLKVDIKAVTYHELVVEETPEGWHVRLIFDT